MCTIVWPGGPNSSLQQAVCGVSGLFAAAFLFSIEAVEVVDEKTGKSTVFPDIESRPVNVSLDYINSCLGLNLSAEEVCKLLCRMQMDRYAANSLLDFSC